MKKKLNIILLILVLSLWGTVIYRYVNQYFMKDQLAKVIAPTPTTAKNGIVKKDTFELKPMSRDPFLGGYKTSEIKSSVTSFKKASPKKEIKPTYSRMSTFPSVQYYGYIKDLDKSKEMILLSVNGKFSKLHLNQEQEGLKVIALTKDSIKVNYNKESKWILFRKR